MSNGDNKLSVGDTIKSGYGFSTEKGAGDAQGIGVLSEAWLKELQEPASEVKETTLNPSESSVKKSLTFSPSDEAVVRKHVEPTHRPSTSYHNSVSYKVAITDNDNSGKISSGDTLLLLERATGKPISEPHTLTTQQADEINGDIDQKHALIENKAKWEKSGIKDYVISGTHLPAGSGGRPGVTGLPVEAKPDITVHNGMAVNPDKNSFTVNDIFAALEKNSNAPSAKYNEQYGYPEYANLPNSDESNLGSIKISLLDEFRGEPLGAQGFSDSHGASYQINSIDLGSDGENSNSYGPSSETMTEQSVANRLENTTESIDKAGSKKSGKTFYDWFKEKHGDVNNDGNINPADVTAWLKGEKNKPAEPAPKPESVSFSGKLSDYSLQAGELGSHGRGNASADASAVLSLKNIKTRETQDIELGTLNNGEPKVISLKFSDGQFSPNSLIDAFTKQRDNNDIVILNANDIGQFGAYGSLGS